MKTNVLSDLDLNIQLFTDTGKGFTQKLLDEDQLKTWEWLQEYLDGLSALLGFPILTIDKNMVCVCATDKLKKARGFQVPITTAIAQTVQRANPITLMKHNDPHCQQCPMTHSCCDYLNISHPMYYNNQLVGAVQIIAQHQVDPEDFLNKANSTFNLVQQHFQLCYIDLDSYKLGMEDIATNDLIIGLSPAMRKLKYQISKTALTDSTVLIQGESGTGKELIAKAIYTQSKRATKPFIAINCAAIPEQLVESEFFGYDTGAFSGAMRGGKKGLLELAHGGTLFLDEVSELALNLQAKLLRVLQERSFIRVGGKQVQEVNVRILAASNKNLQKLVHQGLFRSDLYFRLKVILLQAPALRDHKEDLEMLLATFLTQLGRQDLSLSPDLLAQFHAYSWPGNVRELKNFIEYGLNFCEGKVIDANIFEGYFETSFNFPNPSYSNVSPTSGKVQNTSEVLQEKLKSCGSSVQAKKALAKELGISLATLYRWLKNNPT